ncbi:MAG: nitroreductase [Myxococcaceae bacterium]|nr:nitroreductase [Myxococcaceae bacterium]
MIEERRAIRDFAALEVDDKALREILEASLLAPSSSNLQLYRLHVVRSPEKRAALAAACMNQRAARSAPVLIAIAACPREAAASLREQGLALDQEPNITDGGREHTRTHLATMRSVVRWTSSTLAVPFLRAGLWVARWLRPVPDFATGEREFAAWAIRSSAFAAQTLMLAAQARGYATCPMEGFDRFRAQRTLGLANEHVWLVIALGHMAEEARVEPRWRRPFSTLVCSH